MPVVAESSVVLARGVPQTLFEATGIHLPGFFNGQLDLTQLADANDLIKITLETKYSAGGSYRASANPSNVKQSDEIFIFTPFEQPHGYKLTIELLAASPSASATLEYFIIRSSVPT